MTNSLTKRAFTVAVAAATILWSIGFAALVPQQASAASYGSLIKGTTLSTVYYYGSDGQRYSFPNEKTFFSWYNDFSGVVTMSDAELANITLAGNIAYRPGSHWIKITSDNKTYAVSPKGTIHWIESEAVAKGLAGDNWNQFIDDVPDVFFVDYSVGDSLTSATNAYEGALVMSGSDTWLSWGGKKMKVTASGMTGNMFKAGFVLKGTGATLAGLTAGADITGALANLTDAAQKVTTSTYETAKDVSVSFAGSPSASTLIERQGIADLAHITLTNNSAAEVKLTKATFTRTGVSSDTTLANVYLFDGYTRLTDAATVSDGKITFTDSTGLWTLAPGASKSLIVRSDLLTGSNGQTVGIKLASASDLSFSNGGTASGSFPLMGANHTIAAFPSTFATVNFTSTTDNPAANAALDPQEGYSVFTRTVAVGVNEVWLQSARFRNIGSIAKNDINNFKLFVGGVQRGAAVATADANGYVSFDLSAAPVELKTGNHEVKVFADIIGGSGRTVQLSLRTSADFVTTDSDYSQPVRTTAPTAGTYTFTVLQSGLQTISSGSINFTKASDSPSSNIVNTASGVTLGKWNVKAYGEKMKVENLSFAFVESDGSAVSARNGAVFLNGVQIGSTASLNSTNATPAYTNYTFGSSFIVTPGTPAVLEIRADIFDADGTNNIEADDTWVARIVDMNNASNVQQMTSGGYIDAPDGSAVPAGTVTIQTGTLTVAKNGSYANQNTIDPKTAYKIGSFSVTAGTTEDVNLTDINVDFDGTDVATSDTSEPAAGDMYNLYVMYGPVGNMTTTTTKGSISETANTWSVNYPLKAGATIYVDVYADIDSAISTGEVIQTAVDVNGTRAVSGDSPTTTKQAGQTVTITTPSFTEFNDNHPVAAAVAGNKEVEVARYRFSAVNDTYTIKEMTTSIPTAAATAGSVNEVRLYDGSSMVASTVYNLSSGEHATWTGLSIPVAASSSKTLIVKYLLNSVGSGSATSQTNVVNTLYSVKIANSEGTESTETTGSEFSSVNGNAQWVFASIPTFTQVDLTNSAIVNGQAMDLYKFTVAADSSGSIALKQFKLSTTWSDGVTNDSLAVNNIKFYKDGSDSTSLVTIVDENGNSVKSSGFTEADEDLVVTFLTEDTVSAGSTATYVVRGTPGGFGTVAPTVTQTDSVSFYLAQDPASNGTSKFLNDETDLDAGQSEIMELSTSAAASSNDGSGTADDGDGTTLSPNRVLWSDVSANAHASDANASSTGDWHNSFLLKNLDLGSETWSKTN